MKRKSTVLICLIVLILVQGAFISIVFVRFKHKERRNLIHNEFLQQGPQHDFDKERPFYIFSIIAINTTRGSVWDSFIVNGWETDFAETYTYKCCYLFSTGAISSSRQTDKRRFFYASSHVNARQVVCTVNNRLLKSFPIAVALVLHYESCDRTVKYHKPVFPARPDRKSRFAVHGKICYGDKNPSHLIEWLEYQRYFDVDKVIVYPYHLNENAMRVLKYYENREFVEIVPFSTVPKQIKYPRRFGIPSKIMVHDEQVINYDAQARLSGYTYFTIIDTDEFIVPINRSIKTFNDFMDNLIRKYDNAASFTMHDHLHLTTWGKTNESSKLLITQYGNHSESVISTAKNLHITDRILPGSATIHSAKGQKGYIRKQASSEDVVLKHYRACKGPWMKPRSEYNMYNTCFSGFQHIRDVYMENIARAILPRVLKVIQDLQIT